MKIIKLKLKKIIITTQKIFIQIKALAKLNYKICLEINSLILFITYNTFMKQGLMAKERVDKMKHKPQATLKKCKVNKIKTIFKDQLRSYALQRNQTLYSKKSQSLKHKNITISSTKIKQGNLINVNLMNCPICLELFVSPILTRCGHAFCLHCIESAQSNSSQCCLCRNELEETEWKPSIFYSNFIEKFVTQHLNKEEKMKYQQKIQEFKEKERKRKISQQISIGDKIDVRSGKTWIEGVVIKKQKNKLRMDLSKGDNKQLQFNINSRNMAKLYTFTKRPVLKQKISYMNRLPSLSSVMSSPFMLLINDAPSRFSSSANQNLNIRQIETDLARQLIPERRWDHFDISRNNNWMMSDNDLPFQQNQRMWEISEAVENDELIY